jgi:pimeloyl-ACP methyl ester carboxylesterase
LRLVTGRAALPREVTEPLMLRFRHFRPRMDPLPVRTDAELARLTMPVQLIVGGRDVMLRSAETRDRIARHVPHAQVSFLEDEGHIFRNQAGAIGSFVREAFARA